MNEQNDVETLEENKPLFSQNQKPKVVMKVSYKWNNLFVYMALVLIVSLSLLVAVLYSKIGSSWSDHFESFSDSPIVFDLAISPAPSLTFSPTSSIATSYPSSSSMSPTEFTSYTKEVLADVTDVSGEPSAEPTPSPSSDPVSSI